MHINHLLFSGFSRSWATRYYHDLIDDVIHITVAHSDREEASAFLEAFPSDLYVLDDPSEFSFQLAADHMNPRPMIRPGTQLHANGLYFCFSGFIVNASTGITVAHGVDPGDDIFIDHGGTSLAVGRCCKTFGRLGLNLGQKITADLAVLNISPEFVPPIPNTITYRCVAPERRLRIRIYRGFIPRGMRTEIMIQDKHERIKFGYIHRIETNKCKLTVDHCECPPQVSTCRCTVYNQGCHRVLGIYSDFGINDPMIEEGDSGALVMSRPTANDNFVYVYGIVIGSLRVPEREILTVASQLHHVITHNSERMGLNDNSNAVDFI